jgi:hypothetical protein
MRSDYPDDDVPIREWLRAQRRDDWPKGHLVRIANIIEHESNLHTVGDVRDKADAEFLRLPNVGKESLRSLRERLGTTTVPRQPSADERMASALERIAVALERIVADDN